jgi:imidazolonepropionase-like amidohydrolase
VPTAYALSGIGYDLMPPVMLAKEKIVDAASAISHRKAFEAGVKVAFGTDAGTFPHGENAREFGVLVDQGLSPAEALRAATINAADLLRIPDRGELAVGRLADIIAVAGDPIANVRILEKVLFVMKDGKVYLSPSTATN